MNGFKRQCRLEATGNLEEGLRYYCIYFFTFWSFVQEAQFVLLTLIRCSNKIEHKMFMGEKSTNYNF